MIDFNAKKGFLCDMDGVIYTQSHPARRGGVYPLAAGRAQGIPVFDQQQRHDPARAVPEAPAHGARRAGGAFLHERTGHGGLSGRSAPGCSVYALGEAGLLNALYDAGITMNDVDPDYVIIGEGNTYNYENILKAVRLVLKGAKLIGTNSDLTGPAEDGIIPACRAMIAPIEMATGQNAYFVGKPNPLMMRTGLRILGVHSEEAAMIGDRMDTDMVAGIESGLDTVLVLSGITSRSDIKKFPYRPRLVLDGVGISPA